MRINTVASIILTLLVTSLYAKEDVGTYNYGCKYSEEELPARLTEIANNQLKSCELFIMNLEPELDQLPALYRTNGKYYSYKLTNEEREIKELTNFNLANVPSPSLFFFNKKITLSQKQCEYMADNGVHTLKAKMKNAMLIGGRYRPVITNNGLEKQLLNVEGYIMPGSQTLVELPVVNFQLALNKRDIIYFCFNIDDEDISKNHLTLLVFEGKHVVDSGWNILKRDPSVKETPAAMETHMIQSAVTKLDDFLKNVPILNFFVHFFRKTVDVGAHIFHRTFDYVLGYGVTKVVMVAEEMTVYTAFEVFNYTIPMDCLTKHIKIPFLYLGGKEKKHLVVAPDDDEYLSPDDISCVSIVFEEDEETLDD